MVTHFLNGTLFKWFTSLPHASSVNWRGLNNLSFSLKVCFVQFFLFWFLFLISTKNVFVILIIIHDICLFYSFLSGTDLLLKIHTVSSIRERGLCQFYPYWNIFKENVCTRLPSSENGSCIVDEGSPLFCKRRNGQVFQKGILSFRNCEGDDAGAAYANVGSYVPWIKKIMDIKY